MTARSRLRLHQWAVATFTVSVTAWLVTLGPVSAVLGLAAAKHVLVAVLVMGLGVDGDEEAVAGPQAPRPSPEL